MRLRILILIGVLLPLGCVAPAERRDVPPAPAAAELLTFQQVLTRARLQATGATDAFYLDDWGTLQQAAQSLEQTAELMPRSEGIEEARRQELEPEAGKLASLARELSEAARNRNVADCTDRLQKIGLQIRQLQSKE